MGGDAIQEGMDPGPAGRRPRRRRGSGRTCISLAPHTAAGHDARQEIEDGKQRRSAVAHVIMRVEDKGPGRAVGRGGRVPASGYGSFC